MWLLPYTYVLHKSVYMSSTWNRSHWKGGNLLRNMLFCNSLGISLLHSLMKCRWIEACWMPKHTHDSGAQLQRLPMVFFSPPFSFSFTLPCFSLSRLSLVFAGVCSLGDIDRLVCGIRWHLNGGAIKSLAGMKGLLCWCYKCCWVGLRKRLWNVCDSWFATMKDAWVWSEVVLTMNI